MGFHCLKKHILNLKESVNIIDIGKGLLERSFKSCN